MAQTELTAQQKEMWQNAVNGVANFGGGIVSSAFKPVEAAVQYTAPVLDKVNQVTPSIIPGHPMTDTLSPVIDAIGNSFTNFFDNAPASITESIIGATPEDMIANMAGMDQLKGEDGQRLIQIMKDDPEFAEAFHSAMINEPTMAPGILELANAADGQNGGPSLKTMVDGLSDDGNRSKFTQVLTSVAKTPGDSLDFNYTMDVADAAHTISQPGVKQEDYKRLQALLLRSNIKDPMLDFAADPMAAFEEFKKDPSAFFDQLATSLVQFDGPTADLLRGVIQGMGQYVELLGSPEIMEFYGDYIEPIVNDITQKLGMNGEEATSTVVAESDAAVVAQTPVGPTTPEQQQSLMWRDFKSEINVDSLVGADNDVTNSIKHKAMNAFEDARTDAPKPEETPAPYASPVVSTDLNNARMNFGNSGFGFGS